MKVGLSGIITPGDWTHPQFLSACREAGYQAAELTIRDGGWLTLDTPTADNTGWLVYDKMDHLCRHLKELGRPHGRGDHGHCDRDNAERRYDLQRGRLRHDVGRHRDRHGRGRILEHGRRVVHRDRVVVDAGHGDRHKTGGDAPGVC